MTCPDCQTQLRQFDYKGVRIDECPKCRGRWFDRGELKKAKDRTDGDLKWLDFDPFGEEADRYAVASSKTLLCPKCATPMASLTYSKSGVTIYKCSTCHGIWLNHGEFEAIVKYLERRVDTESASEFARDALRQFEKIATRQEDKISEVRDFFTVLKLLEMRMAVEHPALAGLAEKTQEASPFN